MLRWLLRAFPLTIKDVRTDSLAPLRWSVKKGHFAITEELINHFQLGLEDLRVRHNYLLRTAASQGRVLRLAQGAVRLASRLPAAASY